VKLFDMINTERTVTLVAAESLAPCLAPLIGADFAEVPADYNKVTNTIVLSSSSPAVLTLPPEGTLL
jgi:hypothetical protein